MRTTQVIVRCMIKNWGTKEERYDGATFVLILKNNVSLCVFFFIY